MAVDTVQKRCPLTCDDGSSYASIPHDRPRHLSHEVPM
jgi:hypothetical protein